MISIVVTCHGEAKDLPIILGCIEQQREYGVGKHSKTGADFLYAAGGRCEYPKEVIITCDGELECDPFQKGGVSPYDLRNINGELLGKVIENPKGSAPGHHTRGPGIEAATGDFVLLTNSDNLLVSGWLHRVVTEIEKQPKAGVIYWNTVSNLWKWSDYGGSKLKRGHIDLSAALVRADIAKKIGFPWREYDADFTYISKCCEMASKKGQKIVHINECLGVHN